MMLEKYDVIGKTYGVTRHADPRIVERIIELLHLSRGSTVVDVGAGTGNYSFELANYGYQVVAVEPSLTMRQQGKTHRNLTWIEGSAENLPFHDRAVDGIVCTLAVHHFADVERSLREMIRVVRMVGSIVLFISDPRLCPTDCWLADYFEPIFKQSYEVYPILDDLVGIFERVGDCTVDIQPFLLPPDLTDRFFMSGWRNPEWYLDPHFRQGVSPLANAPQEIVDRCVSRLEHDLKTGTWQEKYGRILDKTRYDGGYRFLVCSMQNR